MAVTGTRPYADPPYPRDPRGEGADVRSALLERAREAQLTALEARVTAEAARVAARNAVAHSLELRWLREEREGGSFAARCAWCRRYRVGTRWLAVGRTPPLCVEATHTICDDCTRALRDAALSV